MDPFGGVEGPFAVPALPGLDSTGDKALHFVADGRVVEVDSCFAIEFGARFEIVNVINLPAPDGNDALNVHLPNADLREFGHPGEKPGALVQAKFRLFAGGAVELNDHEARDAALGFRQGLDLDAQPMAAAGFGVVEDFDGEAESGREARAHVGDDCWVGFWPLEPVAGVATKRVARHTGKSIIGPFDVAREAGDDDGRVVMEA